jgi:hypothetical protein
MLTTSDPAATRAAFETLQLPFEEHDEGDAAGAEMMSIADMRSR